MKPHLGPLTVLRYNAREAEDVPFQMLSQLNYSGTLTETNIFVPILKEGQKVDAGRNGGPLRGGVNEYRNFLAC